MLKKKRNAKGWFWFFRLVLILFGLRGGYLLLSFVCLHYLIFDRAAVEATLAYVQRRFPDDGLLKKRLHVYRIFISQGKGIIDRFAATAGSKTFRIRFKEQEKVQSLIKKNDSGFILLTAHVGNWMLAMTALGKLNRKVYLVVRPEDNPVAVRSLNLSRENEFIKIISPEQDLGGVVEMMKVLGEGGIVSIMGDRCYDFTAVKVDFLGAKAMFPCGAFSIAAASGVPVVVLLSAKLSTYEYMVDMSHIFYPRYEEGVSKREQIAAWVQNFSCLLEQYVNQHPYQCLLFYDVWKRAREKETEHG
ncbi:MAG: lysophospholipid acyltransferase family protein [Candidatus Ratteibacteria bacterium]|jgi:predicted LPLAT superfamily acyltransferase